jgi:hypothetical protein
MKSLQASLRIAMMNIQSNSLMLLYRISGQEELKDKHVKTNVSLLIMRDRLSNNVLFSNF